MKKVVYHSLVFLLSTVYAHAQVPGYLGKKFMFGYSESVSPVPFYALLFEHVESYDKKGNKLGLGNGFLFKGEFWTEVVVARAGSIRLSLTQTKMGLAGSDNYQNYSWNPWFPTYTVTKYSSLNVTDIKASYNTYLFGVAPVGPYVTYSAHYVKRHYTSYNYDQSNTYVNSTSASTTGFGLSFDYGKKTIYFDRLVVDISGSMGFIFPAGIPKNIESSGKKGIFSDPYSRASLLGCKLSVGYLF